MSDRQTESGILLPGQEPEGLPVVVLYLDVPGLTITMAGETDGDLQEVAQEVIDAQLAYGRGQPYPPLRTKECRYGDPLIVTPLALRRTVMVTRGYAKDANPEAMARRLRLTNPPLPLVVPRPPGGD